MTEGAVRSLRVHTAYQAHATPHQTEKSLCFIISLVSNLPQTDHTDRPLRYYVISIKEDMLNWPKLLKAYIADRNADIIQY